MGWPEQVRRLKKAMKDELDATIFDVEGRQVFTREYRRARAVAQAAWHNATPAERDAAAPGIKRREDGR
jgi:hypothetical protein